MARNKSSLHIDDHGSSQIANHLKVRKAGRSALSPRAIMGLLGPLVLLISIIPTASAGERYEYKDLSMFMDALRDNELLRQDVVRKQTDDSAPVVVIRRAKVYQVALVKTWKGHVTVMTYTSKDGTSNFGVVRVPQIKEFLPSMPFIKGLKRDDEVAIIGTVYEYSVKTDSVGRHYHGVYFTGTVVHPPK